jgi:hypothetical protein
MKNLNSLLDASLGIQIKKTSKPLKHTDNRPAGMVEIFSEQEVVGWVSAPADEFPVEVQLYVDGTLVANTWADVAIKRRSKDEVRSFYIATKDIWQYCNRKQRLTIRIDGKRLPIYKLGMCKKPKEDGIKTFGELQKRLTDGYVFDNFGQLQLSKDNDTSWQNKIIEIYESVSKVLEDNHSITPFVIYGSLLGQVREGGFIGHDSDFDIAYISKYTDGRKVARELKEIAMTLQGAGFLVRLLPEAIHIHSKTHPELKIDLFHLYFNADDKIAFPYGVAGTSSYMRKDWHGLTKGKFSGYDVSVPKNAETLVEHIYGASWRVPIAGFNWDHARTSIDKTSHVSKKDCNLVNKEYYESLKK